MADRDREDEFKRLVVPHFDAAYNLAHWLMRDPHEAADILQDASLKAFRFLHSLNSENARSWLFKIVRNTAYTRLKRRGQVEIVPVDETIEDTRLSAEAELLRVADGNRVREALYELPEAHREILVLREIEELSYEELAEVLEIPAGTAMSKLSRARSLFKKILMAKGAVR